ncbi:MAG: hypothetical protein LPK80_10425 [Bacteroidota bacterium]|nr:hypothetical protein [Bacteroidota bacterium]
MLPKEFIQIVLIEETGDVVKQHAYLSFALMAIGIEFLGKCMLETKPDWHNIKPTEAYNKGAELMSSVDDRYEQIDLKDELRNGFAHTFLPKGKIALSEAKHGTKNFQENSLGQTILVAEEFYRDFVIACKFVQLKKFPEENKMNKPFLRIGG